MMCKRLTWNPCSLLRVHSRSWRKMWGRPLIERLTRTAVILLLSLTLVRCGKPSGAEESGTPSPVPDVTIAKVERAPISQNLIVSGNLAALPNRDAKVATPAPGRITRVLVVEGDHVTEGQVLAE